MNSTRCFAGIFKGTKCILNINDSISTRCHFANVAGALKTAGTNGKHSLNGLRKTATEKYEDLFGVTDVKIAQRQLFEAERDFTRTQEHRREKQNEIENLQIRLRDIHLDLDKSHRGEDRYLHLLTQEHAIIKQEKTVSDELRRLDRSERHCFNVLSNRLRENHEKERAREERTKFMSILGSLCGAVVGIAVGTIGTRIRMKDLKKVVQDSTPNEASVQQTLAQFSNALQHQQQQAATFVLDLKTMLNGNETPIITVPNRTGQEDNILRDWVSPHQIQTIRMALEEHDNKLGSDMQEIKGLIASERGYKLKGDGAVVYVGPEMRSMLDKTEKNLETKLRINTLIGVMIVYGALAFTVPVFIALFR